MTLQSSLASKVSDSRDISVYCGRAAFRAFHMHHDPQSCSSVYVSILKS